METPGRILLQRWDRGRPRPRCFRRPRGRACQEIHALHRGILPRQAQPILGMFRREVKEALLQDQENNQTELSRLEINEKKITALSDIRNLPGATA